MLRSASNLLDDGRVLLGQLANAVEIAPGDGIRLDELAAYAQTARTGLEESRRRGQIHAAGRHKADLRQWTAHGLEKGGTDHLGGKDLDDIGSSFPRRQNLGRR